MKASPTARHKAWAVAFEARVLLAVDEPVILLTAHLYPY